MFDKELFLSKIFGKSAYQVIEKSLNLVEINDFSVNNVKDYVYGALRGNFILNDDVVLNFDSDLNGEKSLIMSVPNGYVYIQTKKNEELKYYDYREILEDGSLLHFWYSKDGMMLTEYYNKETCENGNIGLNSDLELSCAMGFSPDYIEPKKKKIGTYKITDLLGQISNLTELRSAINKPKKAKK